MGHDVPQSGRDQDAPGAQGLAGVEPHLEPAARAAVRGTVLEHGGHRPVDEPTAVVGHLGAAGGEELGGRQAVGAEEALHVRRRRVAWRPRVDDDHVTASPGQDQRGGEAGGAAADDHDVVRGSGLAGARGFGCVLGHAGKSRPAVGAPTTVVADPGNAAVQ